MKKTIVLLLVLSLLFTLSAPAFADANNSDVNLPPQVGLNGNDNFEDKNNDFEDDDEDFEDDDEDFEDDDEDFEDDDEDGDPPVGTAGGGIAIPSSAQLIKARKGKAVRGNKHIFEVMSGPRLTLKDQSSAAFDLGSGNVEKTLRLDTLRKLAKTNEIEDFVFTKNGAEFSIGAEELLNKMVEAGVLSVKMAPDGDNLNLVGKQVTKTGIETVTITTLKPVSFDAPKASAGEE